MERSHSVICVVHHITLTDKHFFLSANALLFALRFESVPQVDRIEDRLISSPLKYASKEREKETLSLR